MSNKESLVWYASYGSNMLKKRFLCYIEGGKCNGSEKEQRGCRNKNHPKDISSIDISYQLYFAEKSKSWNNKGVAFIGHNRITDNLTIGRMYLITEEQFKEIVTQENSNKNIDFDLNIAKQIGFFEVKQSWYGRIVYLGKNKGYSIFTFTHYKDIEKHREFIAPSKNYIQIVAAGLEEVRNLCKEQIVAYLLEKPGIKEYFNKEDLINELNP